MGGIRQEGLTKYRVVALLPGVIYGPGPMTEGNLIAGTVDRYLAGKFPGLLGSDGQRWSFSFNADIVDAHPAALEHGNAIGEYVLEGDNRSLNTFFSPLSDLSGAKHPLRLLPIVLAKIIGIVELARARLYGRAPLIAPGVAEIFRHDWVYSSAKATQDLGHRITPLEEGLRMTLEARHD